MCSWLGFVVHFLLVCLQVSARSIQHRAKRIVGGHPVSQPGKWPWIAALIHNNSQYCGGSIVNRRWIVTSSHCFHHPVTSMNPKEWLVKVGKLNLSKTESHEQIFKVKQIIRHPEYVSKWDKYGIDEPDDHDVALMELQGHITYTEFVKSIELLKNSTKFHAGHKCTVAGWGHTHYNGNVQDILHDVTVELISRKKCNSPQSYNGSIHPRAICAGYEEGGRDACQYDSGGPLSCKKAGKWYLVGQVSWGDGCALPHKYGVYSNVQALSAWVHQTIHVAQSVNKHARSG